MVFQRQGAKSKATKNELVARGRIDRIKKGEIAYVMAEAREIQIKMKIRPKRKNNKNCRQIEVRRFAEKMEEGHLNGAMRIID